MSQVYWITGLAGSGKTTLAKALVQKLEEETEKVIFLDGDILRKYVATDIGYTLEERKKGAYRYSGLCKMLYEQGFIVVCATVSMFEEVRRKNRDTIPCYMEIFLDVPKEVLVKRNKKNLYTNQEKNVMGMDILPEFPENPDIIFRDDHGDVEEGVLEAVTKILDHKSE